jgi:O-antigen/teichoic acid export membrane protein
LNPIKKLAGQTAIYGLSTIIGRFLNYLLVPLYVSCFKPHEYGVVTEFYAYVTFLNIILTYGMETGYFKFAQNQKGREVFTTSFVSLFTSTAIFLSAVLLFRVDIANALNYQNHVEYISWFALILAFDALAAIPFANLRIKNKPLVFSSLKILNVLINIVLNVFFILILPAMASKYPESFFNSIYDSKIGVGYIFISNLVASVITFLIFIPDIIIEKIEFSFALLKQMLIYSFPLLIAGLAGNVNDSIDRVIMKYFLPKNLDQMHELGIYGANTKLAVVMILFIQMFRFAAEPFFFSYEKEKDSKKVFADITKYFIIFVLIIFLVITFYLDIFKLILTPNPMYWPGLKVVPLALLANLTLGVYFNLSMWYKLTSKTYFGSRITIIAAVSTVLLNIVLIGKMGYMACAWARFIGYFIMAVLAYIYGQKYYPIKYNWKSIFIYVSIAAILYIISLYSVINNKILNSIKNTFLLFGFITFVLINEKLLKILFNGSKSSKSI